MESRTIQYTKSVAQLGSMATDACLSLTANKRSRAWRRDHKTSLMSARANAPAIVHSFLSGFADLSTNPAASVHFCRPEIGGLHFLLPCGAD
jgi:hypothetical protein